MNPEAEEKLKQILDKDPLDLTSADKAFLRARRQFVGKNSRKKFADVFNEVKEEKTEEEIIEPVEPEPQSPFRQAEQVQDQEDEEEEQKTVYEDEEEDEE